ncbi:unnamed protein product [Medioppia subpectinata]|uniref:Protein-serine/threonine kinase n=1 Tax=Medioppia subpectinata TaxID=1979941 RepID=A0A7R9QEK2_9ACAR|nr:unnamed protein product [Medioppia subpectinata]CAG2118964.1 unnamed protein product [Medioppia subpectinata]
MYIRAFYMLSEYPPITDLESEKEYSNLLRQLLETHKNVVTQLAEGFRECRKHIQCDGPDLEDLVDLEYLEDLVDLDHLEDLVDLDHLKDLEAQVDHVLQYLY